MKKHNEGCVCKVFKTNKKCSIVAQLFASLLIAGCGDIFNTLPCKFPIHHLWLYIWKEFRDVCFRASQLQNRKTRNGLNYGEEFLNYLKMTEIHTFASAL